MIPIAGSAYTYSYATLGEIFAWIIGWDLILEYAVSNVAVCVGFSGYLKEQLAQFGVHLPEKWSSPVWAGGHWTGAYFNLPAFLVVMVLTWLLVKRGARVGADQQHHGGGQDRRHPALPGARRLAGAQRALASVFAQRLRRSGHRRRHHLLHLHRL